MTVQNNASMKNLSSMTGLSEAELQKRAESLIDVKTGKIAALSALDAALVDGSIAGTSNMASFTAAGSATVDVHSIDSPADAFVNGNKSDDGYAKEPPPPPQIGGPSAQLEKAAKAGGKKMSGFCGSHLPPRPAPAAPPPPFSPEGGAAAGGGNSTPAANAPPVVAAPAAPTAPTAPTAPSVTGTAATSAVATAKKGMRTGFGLDGAGPAPGSTAGGVNSSAPGTSSGPTSADKAGAQSELEANSTNMQFEILKMQMQKMQQATDAVSNVVNAMTEEGMTAIRNAKA